MDCKKIYSSLIEKRLSSPATGIVERHHIIPRCLGGDDSQSNIVNLTPREHFVAHLLLAKIHGGKLWSAYYFMAHPKSNCGKGLTINSKLYDCARRNYISFLKTKKGKKNPNYGNIYTEESREKISNKRKKYIKDNHPNAKKEKKNWRHYSGEHFFGSHFDLSRATGLDSCTLRRVASGALFSYKGWSCPDSGRKNMRSGDNNNTSDKNVYTWISPDGVSYTGTRSYARYELGLDQSGTSNLVRGIVKKHKGWSVSI